MKKILLIVVIAFVALIGGCVGCVALGYQAFTKAGAQIEPIAADFVRRWNDRDLPGLYALAGGGGERAEFDRRTTALFDAVGRIEAREQQALHLNSTNGSTTATIGYRITGERRNGVLRLSFDHQGEWKLVAYVVELGGVAPPPAERPVTPVTGA